MSLRRPMQGTFGTARDLKKVNTNPKFSGVKSKLSTGKHNGNVKMRKDRSGELFKRITRRTLASLLKDRFDNEESIYELAPSEVLSVTTIENDEERKIKDDLAGHDFVILDLRDQDDFEYRHIEGAVWCSAANITRDKFPQSVYMMRNQPGKVVILYAEDENTLLGAKTATMLAEKKWENIFMLTGGIKGFEEKYPGCMWTMDSNGAALGDAGNSKSGRLSPRSTLARQQNASQGSYRR